MTLEEEGKEGKGEFSKEAEKMVEISPEKLKGKGKKMVDESVKMAWDRLWKVEGK